MSSSKTPASAFAPEEIRVAHKRVACDGGGGALGHPLVYLEMGEDEVVECGYCDRRFRLVAKPGETYADPSPRSGDPH
jgi:Uncharacterized protein conserved in bacteria